MQDVKSISIGQPPCRSKYEPCSRQTAERESRLRRSITYGPYMPGKCCDTTRKVDAKRIAPLAKSKRALTASMTSPRHRRKRQKRSIISHHMRTEETYRTLAPVGRRYHTVERVFFEWGGGGAAGVCRTPPTEQKRYAPCLLLSRIGLTVRYKPRIHDQRWVKDADERTE